MPHLFDQLKLRGVTLPNRIAVSPMCQYSYEGGFSNEWHLVHLGSRAVGGAGLVMVEATAVSAQGRITPLDMGLWSDQHIEPLARVARFIHSQGSVAGIQLAHAGRKGSVHVPWEGGHEVAESAGGWRPVAPSPIMFDEGYAMPDALTEDGIHCVVSEFAEAARRAREAGFRLIELHAAHGYLAHEFLSPLSNHRTDGYGGSFENRTRFLREVVIGLRSVWPDAWPLLVRISATDWMDGGWTMDDSVALARCLSSLGADLIDCSSGGNAARAQVPMGPGFQTPFAERIRRETGVLTAAVGMITAPAQADHVIRSGQADLVVLAREMLRDPYWPMRAARELGYAVPWPVQYSRVAPKDAPVRSALNLDALTAPTRGAAG